MTSIPSQTNVLSGARPAHAPGPIPVAAGMPAASIDPLKLLRRYKFTLIGSVIAGGFLGVLIHFVWLFTYPMYRAYVVFECFNQQTEVGMPTGANPGEVQELERFMFTQMSIMTSDQVLRRVIEDPQLEREAPEWVKPFYKNGKLQTDKALRALQDDVGARMIPRTRLIEMSLTFQDKEDVAAVVRLVKQSYLRVLREQAGRAVGGQRDSISRAIAANDDEISKLTDRRSRLVQESQIDTIDQRTTEAKANLALINEQLVNVNLDMEAVKVRITQAEEQLASPGGIRYGDDLRDEVEQEQQVQQLQAAISNAEANLEAIGRRFRPDHRDYKAAENELAALRQSLESVRERMLRQRFDGQLDSARVALRQFEAQRADLLTKQQEVSSRLTDLTRIASQIEDITLTIQRLIESRNTLRDDLANIDAISRLDTANRVVVYQDERVPERVTMPKLKVLLPAALVLTPLLVGGVIVLRELVDQRVRGASDVVLIPRTRVAGVIPDAAEDPAGSGAVETAFRDRARGVVAEAFRQLRTVVLKRVQQAGHKTIVIAAGMPGSGATSTAANLALACAAADQRVLLIDANFRRPSQHRVMACPEAPGLADVLGGKSDMASAVRATNVEGLSVLAAGSKELRQFERLGSPAMGRVLDEAKASFDLILIDTAPAVVAGDALAIASRADASLLVIRAMAEKRGMVARIKNELSESRAELLGVVVNAVKSSAGGYLKGNIRATHEYHVDARPESKPAPEKKS